MINAALFAAAAGRVRGATRVAPAGRAGRWRPGFGPVEYRFGSIDDRLTFAGANRIWIKDRWSIGGISVEPPGQRFGGRSAVVTESSPGAAGECGREQRAERGNHNIRIPGALVRTRVVPSGRRL
jgi:hypothetical protein